MIIKKIYIDNFGKLCNFDYEFDEGLNLFIADNGWGKSTLATFIRVMLFGFEGENKRGTLCNERKRYMPWQEGTYGGYIHITNDDQEYIIRRRFGKKKSDDSFELRNAVTNLVSDDYSEKIGEEILGINSESFQRTVYIGQGDVATHTTDGINARIAGYAGNVGEIDCFEDAYELLRSKLNKYSHTRSTGSLYKLKEEVTSLKRKVAVGDALSLRINNENEERSKLEVNIRELQNKKASIEKEMDTVSKTNELQLKLGEHKRLTKEYESVSEKLRQKMKSIPDSLQDKEVLDQLIKKAQRLELLYDMIRSNTEKDDGIGESRHSIRRRRLSSIILLVVGTIGLIISTLMFFDDSKAMQSFGIMCVIWCAIDFLYVALVITRNRGTRKAWKKQTRQSEQLTRYNEEKKAFDLELTTYGLEYSDSLVDELFVFVKRLGELENLQDNLEYRRRILKEFESYNKQANSNSSTNLGDYRDISTVKNEYSATMSELDRLKGTLIEIDKQLDKDREMYGDCLTAKRELDIKKQELEEGMRHYECIELASKYLLMAKENLSTKYMSPLLTGFEKYYKGITMEEDTRHIMDANLSIHTDELNGWRDIEELSAGYSDIISFCLRLALVDAMYSASSPILILDDPFINLDDNKRHRAYELLKELCTQYQIVYLSCHNELSE